MERSRDDFVIAVRSAFLKKSTQQRYSILSLILFSIIFITLGNFNFKIINYTKILIRDVIYTASFVVTVPENLIKKSYNNIVDHYEHYGEYKDVKIELEKLKAKDLSKQIIIFENIQLKRVIDDYFVKSSETFAKVLIDKRSPFLRSIVINKGSKNGIKIGMIVLDDIYLIGKVVEVNYLTSRVLLVSDINSKVPVSIEPIGIQAIMSGTGKQNGTLQYLNVENIKSNNKDLLVVTSGAGSVFNSGIPIGKINKEIDLNNEDILVNFYKDFTQLKYVKVSSNKKITVDQSNKQQLEVSNKQIETITSQKESFEVLRKQKAIDDEIRVRIDTENSELKKKLVESNSKLKKLERDKNLNQIEEEEIKFLRLNLLYSHKCRKTMFNQLYKVNTLAYKACILTKEKR
jgi:rod shape-determining protein MreC